MTDRTRGRDAGVAGRSARSPRILAALRTVQRELDGLGWWRRHLRRCTYAWPGWRCACPSPSWPKLAKVSAATVSQLELGAHRPRQTTLRRIISALQSASRKLHGGAELESAIGAMGADLGHVLPLAPPTASWPVGSSYADQVSAS